MTEPKIAVLGGGSWGSTLATRLAKNGQDVAIWEFNPEVAKKLERDRTLETLPALRLPSSVYVTSNLKEALKGRRILVSATPSHTVRSTFQAAMDTGVLEQGIMVVSTSKGIENDTHLRMSEIISEVFPGVGDIVILAGPSHAEEVAQGQPVALVAASNSGAACEQTKKLFGAETMRIYTSDDPVGVELGGALKNVYALAGGIADGLKLGDNVKAALITRGLAEITRLGKTLEAKTLTFFGLSGLGDLIVTCGSRHSRNRKLGEMIGKGKSLKEALSEMTMVAEGVKTTESAYQLAKTKQVDVPIINEIYMILYEDKPPQTSLKDLMARQAGAEMEGIIL